MSLRNSRHRVRVVVTDVVKNTEVPSDSVGELFNGPLLGMVDSTSSKSYGARWQIRLKNEKISVLVKSKNLCNDDEEQYSKWAQGIPEFSEMNRDPLTPKLLANSMLHE